VCLIVACAVLAAGCPHAAGNYVQSDRQPDDVDRGEVNGRTLDFVDNKDDDEDWSIRIRGSSMWASYAKGTDTAPLGTVNLDDKETKKLWALVDALDLPSRKKGKKDVDTGFVTFVLREPGEDQHDIHTVYISRDTEDDDVTAIATYFIKLFQKYHKKKPAF
jgi:hypothetical protein